MKLTAADAAKIATLARLKLSQDKLELFAGQFQDILGHMDTLNEVDTTDVEPMYSPSEGRAVFREDVAASHCGRDDILSNAPEDDGAFFVVPKIVAGS